MPDTDTKPLAMSVELAREVEGEWSGETGHVERDAAIIDARIRPLVQFVRSVEMAIDYAEEHGHPTVFHDFEHLRERLDAALKTIESGAAEPR